jgi:hypothetical protein
MMQHAWQEFYVPGAVVVGDETRVGWKGATKIHITNLPDKPTSKGVCLKTLCDAWMRIMVAMEFVESRTEQVRYAEEGLSAAVCLRLTEAGNNKAPRLLLADAWFGGVPSAFPLAKRDCYSIMNVKLQTEHFCKRELWAGARGEKAEHKRHDRAYRQLTMKGNGRNMAFTGAFHMDKKPITLLCTTGSSKEVPVVTRRRLYMDADGDLVRWHGKLRQPDAHYICRSNFNAVDVYNKLATGPQSICSVGANSLVSKLFLSVDAFAETNAYLMYVKHHKLSWDEYNHSDFKVDLDRAMMQCAQHDGEWPIDNREAEGVTRGSRGWLQGAQL